MSRNTTATGGILQPLPQPPTLTTVPPNLTFVEFIQQMLAGLSGFRGDLVRPQWQKEPPKNPDIDVNWLAFGLGDIQADNNAYIAIDTAPNGDPQPSLQRNELIPISISVYGPQAYDNVTLIRDGFQLTQNLASLRAAKVGFAYDTPARHVPDFFGERWYERWILQVYVRRQVQRVYPILTFISAQGTIYAETGNGNTTQLPIAASGE